MRVFIIYCPTPNNSIPEKMCNAFAKGIKNSGNDYVMSCLQGKRFDKNLIGSELNKINTSDAIAFFYPFFAERIPEELVKWFDRVWSFGYANDDINMKILAKGTVFCFSEKNVETKDSFGLLYSIKKVMFGYKLFKRTTQSDFYFFDNICENIGLPEKKFEDNLNKMYEKGRTFFIENQKIQPLAAQPLILDKKDESGTRLFRNFYQKESVIWADYSGGNIKKGFLVGTKDDSYNFHFDYQHVYLDGEEKSGFCNLEAKLENGKVIFNEKWNWMM